MPITDAFQLALAKKHRLYFMICRQCGARNAWKAKKCRSHNLRQKNREFAGGMR